MIGSDEGITMVFTDAKVIHTMLGNVDGIKLGFDAVTGFGSLDGSFGNIHWLFWLPKPR